MQTILSQNSFFKEALSRKIHNVAKVNHEEISLRSEKTSEHVPKISWPQKLQAEVVTPIINSLGWPDARPKIQAPVVVTHEFPWPKEGASCVQVCGGSHNCMIKCAGIHDRPNKAKPDDSAIQWPQPSAAKPQVIPLAAAAYWPQQPQQRGSVPRISPDLIGGSGSPGSGGPDDIVLTFAVGGLSVSALTDAELVAFRNSLASCTYNQVIKSYQ
jgi:hypothetical protein